MQLSNIPSRIATAFASATSALKRTIPIPSQSGVAPGNVASWTDGFPPKTAQLSGGVAPSVYDFNGVLNAMSAIQQWQCGGGLFSYDATWSSTNTGYPKGALLLRADGQGYWRNIVDANTSNPDTGGAGWSNVIGNMFGVGQTLTGTSLISAPTGSIIILNSAAGATATLPSAAGIAGQQYLIHVTNAGGNWNMASSSGVFNGSGLNAQTNFTATPLETFIAISDGTNWLIEGLATPAVQFGVNGYVKLSNGIIFQWGFSGGGTVTLPTSYSSAQFVVLASNADAQGSGVDNAFGYTVTASSIYLATKNNGGGIGGFAMYYFTVGR